MNDKIYDLVYSSSSVVKTVPFKNLTLLNGGELGLILYWSYLGKISNSNEFKDIAVEKLNSVFDKISRDPSTISNAKLFYGVPALLSVCKILKQDALLNIEIDKETESALIYQFILNIEKDLDIDNTDFLYGFSGTIQFLATYFKDREHDLTELISTVTLKLIKKANITKKGSFYFNSYFSKKNDTVSLGISHGQCGILLSLCSLLEMGICEKELSSHIPQGIEYILSLTADKDQNLASIFPTVTRYTEDKHSPFNNVFYGPRVAWCYGDINIALLLYRAGRLLSNNDYIKIADSIGLHSAKRLSPENMLIDSAGFCHGASSLVQFYKSLFKEGQKSYYDDAKKFWLAQAIFFYEKDLEYCNQREESKGDLLNGIVGSSIVLMSELLNDRTSWQELFTL
ncbi:Lanthionine synthetase C-like protein [Hydrobacter penzbergensis]|uniref:Lanthionine synthetase C-like protein n=1 Tax=Hydrobacter penzbergensis TaxID=1235997 RepID=A0A8X8IGC5_9BACT|nr:lanthionine synthetase LanC family protein [Hydrobacter penzbergensis]SDX01018.1 Lanthionine synthetase C-like protein [Hydrobacter penzbergensis]